MREMKDDTSLKDVDSHFRPFLMEANDQEIGSAVIRWNEGGFTARVVRGRKMKIFQGVFDESRRLYNSRCTSVRTWMLSTSASQSSTICRRVTVTWWS